jgi:acyl-coenzyme A synthetase/AMP-(fatty) acid ligase
MKNMSAVVIDENQKVIKEKSGEKGELCLAGFQLTPGYWQDAEKNAATFFKLFHKGHEEIFYKTGDLAFQDEDGDFLFAGRIDNQVKIQGFRVELGEIEYFAREFVKPCNVIATACQNNFGTVQIYLFLENYNNNIFEVEEYLKSKLPEYMRPSFISTLPFFPLNANGKIDRKQLINVAEEKMRQYEQ